MGVRTPVGNVKDKRYNVLSAQHKAGSVNLIVLAHTPYHPFSLGAFFLILLILPLLAT